MNSPAFQVKIEHLQHVDGAHRLPFRHNFQREPRVLHTGKQTQFDIQLSRGFH